MIDESEILARASKLGLQRSHIEKDYVLNHLLAAIGETDTGLIFRGGTALARVYWPDFRLSEDLDFICVESLDMTGLLGRAVAEAGGRSGFRLELEPGKRLDGFQQLMVKWDQGAVALDVNTNESAYLPVGRLPLSLPYSDLSNAERMIDVVALEEILGNKWFMLADRHEPRDLYDIWAGLYLFGLALDDVAAGFLAKYGYGMKTWPLTRAEALRNDWEVRLAYQVADLPPFDHVMDAVRAKAEQWEQEGRG